MKFYSAVTLLATSCLLTCNAEKCPDTEVDKLIVVMDNKDYNACAADSKIHLATLTLDSLAELKEMSKYESCRKALKYVESLEPADCEIQKNLNLKKLIEKYKVASKAVDAAGNQPKSGQSGESKNGASSIVKYTVASVATTFFAVALAAF